MSIMLNNFDTDCWYINRDADNDYHRYSKKITSIIMVSLLKFLKCVTNIHLFSYKKIHILFWKHASDLRNKFFSSKF